MLNILTVIHVLAAISIIVLVLMQQGRGADMGAAFGGGGSQSLFGARGSSNFLSKTTALLAATFFFTSISLAFLYAAGDRQESVTEGVVNQIQLQEPSTDVPAVPDSGQEPTQESTQDSAQQSVDNIPAVPEPGDGAPSNPDSN